MKIKKLKIEGYKNLDIEFVHSSDIIAIIGNNASGKSNLLEALCAIFKSLYASEEVSFDYLIEYVNSSNQTIQIEKQRSKITYKLNNEVQISIKEYLPKNLIAIYSGDEDRLWRKYFAPFYTSFVSGVNKAAREGTKQENELKMIYVDKHYWHLSLLALAISDLEENKSFLKNTLGINKIDKIKFEFDSKNFDKYNDNLVLNFLKNIDSSKEYTLKQFKEILNDSDFIPDDVYKYLYLAFALKNSKIIEDIIIKFNTHLTIEDLSEGEKKLLLIRAAMEFAGQEDSLFILDEPDAHVHINNKEQIIKATQPYKINRQIIITTHSPTITQCLSDENIQMIDRGSIIAKKKQEVIAALTSEFWNKHEQGAFLSNDKKLILLVEGRHDKTHIQYAYDKLKDEFNDLDFATYSLGGETKIHPFLNGLYEADLKKETIYLGIYDNDQAGQTTLNKAGFEAEKENCGYRKLRKDKIEHNHFFSFLLPKPQNHNTDCTIENMYESNKYEEAYKEALQKNIGHFSNKSIAKISEDLSNSAKNQLESNAKSFEKEDFKYFRSLFNLISKISKVNQALSSQIIEDITVTQQIEVENVEPSIFYLKTKSIQAKANYNKEDETIVVLKGSQIVKLLNEKEGAVAREMNENEVKNNPTNYTLLVDKIFNSPSTAAKFVTGRSSNGWKEWKNEEGKTLDEIYRK